MRSAIPVVVAYIPMGMAYAITARTAGLKIFETIMMSVCVFTGAGQMLAAQMLCDHADIIVIIIATFVINLRYMIMSTCVVNGLRGSPLYQKMFATFGVTDEAFAIFTTRSDDNRSMTYWMGLMLTTYASWITGAVLGAVTSEFLPDVLAKSFNIAMYAMFIALLVPSLRGNWRLLVVVAFTVGVNCLLTFVIHLQSSWSIVVSTLLGAGFGVFFMPDSDIEKENKADGEKVEMVDFDDTVQAENPPNHPKNAEKTALNGGAL